METPIEPQEEEKDSNLQTLSFTGEFTLAFPLEVFEQEILHDGINTFIPKQTLRGANWSYPYPVIALSEDATIQDYIQHFGAAFVKDLFEDALGKLCQLKWRGAIAAKENNAEALKDKTLVDYFKESFFESRRDTGPTSEKLSKEIAKKLKHLRLFKENLSELEIKSNPELKKKIKEIKDLKNQMQELLVKEAGRI